MNTLEEKIKKLNEECGKCQQDFQECKISFSPSICKTCKIGAKLHDLLKKAYEGEKKWDAIDWESSKYKDFYNG